MINPDVTAHVLRPPVGEWIAITGDVVERRRGPLRPRSLSQLIQLR
jgi:hypothetical protein